MTKSDIEQDYFAWMCKFVCNGKYRHFYKLLNVLNDIEFTYSMDMDGNRYEDGIDLRYRYGDECYYKESMIADYLDRKPCSVLEMLVALSIRIEVHIMDNPDIGNRTGQWFWNMIDNLGLTSMDDEHFNKGIVINAIHKWLNHDYESNGKGGLFTINDCKHDLRYVEIWYQACWYLDRIV